MTSKATVSVTFLRVSADGLTRSVWQDGRKISQPGQGAALVNLSARAEKEKRAKINGICGQHSSGSLESQNLTRCLVNKLQMQSTLAGSTIYKQTWKVKTTPLGIVYWAHTASARRTLDNGCIGWPTPLEDNANNSNGHAGTRFNDLPTTAKLMGWPTASSRDWKDTPGMAITGFNPDGTKRKRLDQLPRVAQLAGQTLTGADALTENSGSCRLNVKFSLWLMGYPEEWACCGERAMQSCRK